MVICRKVIVSNVVRKVFSSVKRLRKNTEPRRDINGSTLTAHTFIVINVRACRWSGQKPRPLQRWSLWRSGHE